MTRRFSTLIPVGVVLATLWGGCSESAETSSSQKPPRRADIGEILGLSPDVEVVGPSAAPSMGAAVKAQAATVAAPAPITRTLKAKDGRTLEAVLISRTQSTVTIRRVADQAVFTLPLDTLADEDRRFIQSSRVPMTPGM